MGAVVPGGFTEDTEVQITLKSEGKTFTAPGTFKIKSLPQVTYVSSTKAGYRKPLKVLIKNKKYFNNGAPEVSFCGTICSVTSSSMKGDTLLVTPSLPYAGGTSYSSPFTLKFSGNLPAYISYEVGKPVESITFSTKISFCPTYKLTVYKGKPGDSFTVVFDNAKYFATDMTIKLGETTVAPKGVDVAAGEGYVNPLVAFYKVPNLSPGTYTISITDKENMEYLPEAGIQFIVE